MAGLSIDTKLKDAVKKYVSSEAWDQELRQTLLQTIVAALNERQDQLLGMVMELEDVLQDKSNPNGRKQAVRLLCDCLASEESQLKLNDKHVETFTTFFCSKLSDWQCVEGAIGGLLAIFQRNGLLLRTLRDENDVPLATGIARTLFKEVHTPSHTQAVRNAVLILISLLITEWRAETEALGEVLGEGIVTSIEEERDPRNLLISFRLAEKLMEECDPSCVTKKTLENLFEALTSYFPITFTPPKDDKFGITGDDLRNGLARSLSVSPRLAEFVVPFFLDAAKDITVGDSDATIQQALELNGACLERYGPEITKKHLKDILKTAQDQVCRTTTPCPVEFADFMRKALSVAFRDVQIGLHPSWLSRLVDPVLTSLAQDAARGESSLASSGSRRLLLAAAAAHPVLLEHTWTLSSSLLLPKPEVEGGPLPCLEENALAFVLNFARLSEGKDGPLLRPRQVKSMLAASLSVLCGLKPGSALSPSDDGEARPIFAVAVELVGRLCTLVGEDGSSEAFAALKALLPMTKHADDTLGKFADDTLRAWSAGWRAELFAAPGSTSGSGTRAAYNEDARMVALEAAVVGIAGTQPARAVELAPELLTAAALPQLPAALPRLLAVAAFSLARCAVDADGVKAAEAADGAAESKGAAAADSAKALLAQAASLMRRPEVATETAQALADALTATGSSGAQTSSATLSWAATVLAGAMELPAELQRLSEGMGVVSLGDAMTHDMTRHATAIRRLIRGLGATLPTAEATALRNRVLELTSGAEGRACIGLVPAALPEAAEEDWVLCQRVLPSLEACISDAKCVALEPQALEALEALVESCPPAEVEGLLEHFRSTFGKVITAGAGTEPHVARAAAMCWAVVAGALLRRGGFSSQASAFLEALLAALEKEGPVTCHVPLAFQVLMPPRFDSSSAPSKLPPIAMQQLSRTTLPSLLSHAKESAKAGGGPTGSAALASAVMLLCALPTEVACADCADDLRWCVLTGLKDLSKAAAAASGDDVSSAFFSVFAPQVLLLLVRAMRKGTTWVEDDLHSVVLPLTSICSSHCVPLVRLACFQALSLLIQEAHGHLTPYRRMIEKATRCGVEDRKREVRLVAIECLNVWHCGAVAD